MSSRNAEEYLKAKMSMQRKILELLTINVQMTIDELVYALPFSNRLAVKTDLGPLVNAHKVWIIGEIVRLSEFC